MDNYALIARLLPAVIALAPLPIVLASLHRAFFDHWERLSAIGLATVATSLILGNIARSQGRKLEREMDKRDGGKPTTRWLRHRDNCLDPVTKQRYHRHLAACVPNWRPPTQEREAANQIQADHSYESAVKWLLEHTRNRQQYPLVYKENVSYGFRRNLVGMRPIGIIVCLLSVALIGWEIWQLSPVEPTDVSPEVWFSSSVVILSLFLWFAVFTKAWVQDASEAYARALLATCETKTGASLP